MNIPSLQPLQAPISLSGKCYHVDSRFRSDSYAPSEPQIQEYNAIFDR